MCGMASQAPFHRSRARAPECGVCFQSYSGDVHDPWCPMSLPCGHSFCSGCISALRSMSCPTCRTVFQSEAPRPNFELLGLLSSSPPSASEVSAQVDQLIVVDTFAGLDSLHVLDQRLCADHQESNRTAVTYRIL